MARPEQSEVNGQLPPEVIDPRHFYAAYVFDNAETQLSQVQTILQEAKQLRYRVRYWWLSDALDLQGAPDRLIVCVHHPSTSPEAGMELYEALKRQQVTWDDLDAASVEEYCFLGRSTRDPSTIRRPDGLPLFPAS